MSTTTRERIVSATADLLRRQGYNATVVKQIVQEARAPFGSVYHHFPGGKEEVSAEAVRTSGEAYARLLPAIFDQAPDLVTGVRMFFAQAAEDLEDSGYQDACPIATVALEVASTNENLRRATAEVFDSWIVHGTRYFEAHGVDPAAARELTVGVITALEGAFVLARASRSTEALLVAGTQIAHRFEAVLASRPA